MTMSAFLAFLAASFALVSAPNQRIVFDEIMARARQFLDCWHRYLVCAPAVHDDNTISECTKRTLTAIRTFAASLLTTGNEDFPQDVAYYYSEYEKFCGIVGTLAQAHSTRTTTIVDIYNAVEQTLNKADTIALKVWTLGYDQVIFVESFSAFFTELDFMNDDLFGIDIHARQGSSDSARRGTGRHTQRGSSSRGH